MRKQRVFMAAFTVLLSLFLGKAMAQHVDRQFVVSMPHDSVGKLFAFLPERDKASGRAVVACPGGAYHHLSLQNEGTDWAEFFSQQGIAYFVLQYRMPDGDRTLPVSDAVNAMRLIRDSAEVWGVNPYDVGIMGFSAGGHLASTVSTHAEFDARPNFSILFYPVITMGKNGQHEGSCVNFLGDERDDEGVAREYSNELQVRRHLTPPAAIFLANDDRGVPPVANGIAYYSAMRNAGNNCSLHVYTHGGHGFGIRQSFPFHQQMMNELEVWLSRLKAPRKDAVRVACIGNSITDGSGIDMAENHGYPAQLQQLLGEGYHVKNFGVGARTLLNKGDFPYMNELAWRDALAFNPHVVVIKLGTNDSKTENWKHHSEFAADYQQMIDSLKALPSNPRIILAHPIKAFKDQWTISDSVIVNEVIPAIDAVARNNHLEVIDLYSAISDPKFILSDGIHPNEKGAGVIAQQVAEMIKTPYKPYREIPQKGKRKRK